MSVYPAKSVNGILAFEKPLKEILREIRPGGGLKVLDPDECISEKQNSWLHCENGPIRVLMKKNKMGFMEAKVYLKTEFGKHWFVRSVNGDNYESAKGVLYWYCLEPLCEQTAIHILRIAREGNIRQCPKCGSGEIRLIAVKSINQVSVKNIKLWFDEITRHYPELEDGRRA